MNAFLPLSLALLSSLAGAQVETAEGPLRPRWMPTKDLSFSLNVNADSQHLILKVRDDWGAVASQGRLVAAPDRPLPLLTEVLDSVVGLQVRPMVDLPRETLNALRQRGQARLGEQLADMTQYFELRIPDGVDGAEILRRLLALESVENAYAKPNFDVTGDIGIPTPDFTAGQGYKNPAPQGINAAYANGYPNGAAAGQTIVDIEWSWQFEHEDLQGLDPSDQIGVTQFLEGYDFIEHGTAVMGVIGADQDAAGISGIAHQADLKVAPVETETSFILAQQLIESANNLQTGDVILIEIHGAGPNATGSGQFGFLPVEYWDGEFNAIRTVTANGIHVVEAGGNGYQNLDSTEAPTGHPTYPDRFWLSRRDSGALMVGAGQSTVPHPKHDYSSFGSRIDAYSWGDSVTTLGYGAGPSGTDFGPCNLFPAAGNDVNQYYTSCFNGTSSASPIVASAVSIINATHEGAHGSDMGITEMRQLLRGVGTLSSTYGISRQPDLRQQLPRVAAGPQLMVYHLPDDLRENLFPQFYGDLNGDGVSEWFAGEFEDGFEGVDPQHPGRMRMFDGNTGEEFFIFDGLEVGDRFGEFILLTKDFDQDGLPEVLVGAPGAGSEAGAVTLLSPSTGQKLVQFDYEKPGARLGSAACEIGDWNGDGVVDFAVGAPGSGAEEGGDGGAVIGLSGSTGEELFSIHSQKPGERFGTSLVYVENSELGDVLAVGAPKGSDGLGRIAIIGLQDLQEFFSEDGPAFGSDFGATMIMAPDMDGNGVLDLLVGAPGANSGAGSIRRVSLTEGDKGPFFELFGFGEAHLGAALALTPDHDGDGEPEVIAGAPDANGINEFGEELDANGRVLLISGKTGQTIQSYRGAYTSNRFGLHVAGGNSKGTGPGDVLVGAGGQEGALLDRGAAYGYSGEIDFPIVEGGAPQIVGITPDVLEAVKPDECRWLVLTGSDLGQPVGATVGGVELHTKLIEVIDDSTIRLEMPLVPLLGQVEVKVETVGGAASTFIEVVPNAQPALDVIPLGSNALDPAAIDLEDADAAEGVIIIIGSAPSDVALLYWSDSDVPTTVPGVVDLAIGNNLQSLFLYSTALMPSQGWTQQSIAQLPELGSPYDVYLQAIVINPFDPNAPLEVSNPQGLSVN